MYFLFIATLFYLGNTAECPEKPDDYLDLPSKPESGNKYYSCNKEFGYDMQFGLTNSILSIYYCTFKNIVAVYNKESLGIIKIKIDDSMSSTINGNINIEYCSFESCYGAILIDSTDSSRKFNIYNCTFTRCQAMKGAAMIDFKSVNGDIEKCHFRDCLTIDSSSGYISFNPPKIENNDKTFSIVNTVFEHSIQNSYAFLSIANDNGKLNFINNKAVIPVLTNEMFVISYSNNANIADWSFSDNCIYPFRPDAITSTNSQIIVDSFSQCKSDKPECPPFPMPDSKKYSNHCYEEQKDNETDIVVKNSLVALYICSFTNIKAGDSKKGGAVYVLINYKFDDIYLPFFIYNCSFDKCTAHEGGAIYIETIDSYVSRTFEIKDCKFSSNKCFRDLKDDVFGGAICIVTIENTFEISGCEFESNEAGEGGAIYFGTFHSNSYSSRVLLEDDYALSVSDCTFKKNKAYGKGAAVCVMIKDKKPIYSIEVTNCEFSENRAEESEWSGIEEELPENGGAIYLGFNISVAGKFKVGFRCFDCTFSRNVASSKGGAICISIDNKEQLNYIEISHCTFKQNLASTNIITEIKCFGSDICYTHDSLSSQSERSSNVLLETSPAFQVSDCTFSDSLSKDRGGSIYLSASNEQAAQSIEFIKCTFKDITQSAGGAFDIQSNNPSVRFHLFDCDFQGESSLFFNGITGHVEKCRFTDIKKAIPIHYECSLSEETTEDQSFTVEGCTFYQNNEIDSLIFFVPKASSRFIFTHNEISIPNNKTFVFNCDGEAKLDGLWRFIGNSITPDNENLINSENAAKIHFRASCLIGFKCTSHQLPGFECEKNKHCFVNGDEQSSLSFVDVSNSNFNGLKDEESKGGGAIRLINYGIVCNNAEFKECSSEKEGGGAIYIHINKILESSVSIFQSTFTKCTAVYGGAIYIYSDKEDNQVEVNNCNFIQNKAKKKGEVESDSLHGGAAIYVTVKSGEINNCIFQKNSGNLIKVSDNFANSRRSIKEMRSMISIDKCSFDSKPNSKLFIDYDGSNGDSVLVDVKNSFFKGKLLSDEYQISRSNIKSLKDPSFKSSFQKANYKAIMGIHLISILIMIIICIGIISLLVIKIRVENEETNSNGI